MATDNKDALSVNAKIKAAVEIYKDGPFVELKGFVGPSDDSKVVRLYRTLVPNDYWDIPQAAIRLAEKVEGNSDGKVRLLIAPSTKVERVHIDQGAVGDFDQKVAGRYKLPTNTISPTCDLLEKIIPKYEEAIACRCLRLPAGGWIALTDEQVDWLQGELNSLNDLSDKLLCGIF